jgi:DNA-directed RNA polymerase specialized sigma subunit
MNKTKKLNRTILSDDVHKHLEKEEDVPYDIEWDESIEEAHNQVLSELKDLQKTKLWASSKIFELYWMSSDTLEETANRIGISKSTTFLAVKKIRKYLKEIIPNPFKDA